MREYVIIAVSSAALLMYCARKYYQKTTGDIIDKDLNDKIVVVTGSSSGIGRAAAKEFAQRGARVILACRNLQRAGQVAHSILHETGNTRVTAVKLDLSSFESINNFVHELKSKESRIDILVNNAGVFFIPLTITEDGVEMVFQVNYLGAFYLTMLCMDLLKSAPTARIINVSSHGHHICSKLDLADINFRARKYGKFQAYAQSKLALILFTRTLSEKLKHTKITVNAITPGNVDSEMYRHFPLLANPVLRFIQWPLRKLIFKNETDGAKSIIHAAFQETSGQYFSNFRVKEPSPLAKDPANAEKLWDFSMKLVHLDINL